jgi:O-antigen ligase
MTARAVVVHSAGRLALLVLAAHAELRTRGTAAVLRAYLVGTMSIAVVVAWTIATRGVQWSTQSNSVASASMGPDQIGFLFTFGAFAALILAGLAETRLLRVLLLGLVAIQALGTMLTFARGPALALGACILFYATAHGARRRGSPAGAILLLAILVGTTGAAVRITDSMFIQRFQKEGFSNRDVIARGAWEIFSDQPFIGIGTGNFYRESAERGVVGRDVATGAHNESLRALAEHGLLGAVVYFLFLFSSLIRTRQEVFGRQRTICLIWLGLALLSEFHLGLKLSSQGLLMALACEAFRDRSPKGVGLGCPRSAISKRGPFPSKSQRSEAML